jgi:hypothetical protein
MIIVSSKAQIPPKVFISYSHDSPEHKSRVRELSDRLRQEGVDSNIDQYEQSPPEGWPRWMERQIEEADFVLVVCTETYERRFRGVEKAGRGLGGSWEGAILTQHLYDAQARNTRFIPVLFSPRDESHVPVVLRGATRYRLDTEEGYVRLYTGTSPLNPRFLDRTWVSGRYCRRLIASTGPLPDNDLLRTGLSI